MDMQLIDYLKDFLQKNNIDGLIVNSSNEFLSEYNMLELNSRYYLTGFSGSTGDVLFTAEKIYQFADTRYHEQAESEIDRNYTSLIKIPLGKSYIEALDEVIPFNFKLGIISSKTSKKFYDALKKRLEVKNGSIKLFNSDPVSVYKKKAAEKIQYDVFKIPIEYTGSSADDKFLNIKEYAGEEAAILVTSLEDIAYLTNMRSYDFPYSAVFPAKALITSDNAYIYTDCEMPAIGSYFCVKPMREFENMLKNIERTCLYIDEDTITIADYNMINRSNTVKSSWLKLMKTVKNDVEKEHLNSCFARSDKALRIIQEMINSDTIYSEYDYYAALRDSMYKEGALSLSFKPIAAAGSNSSIVHYSHPSKEKMVEDGDLLLVDFGGYYEGGLATDTTRTFIKGTPSDEQKKAYTAVLKAFLNAYYKEYTPKSSYYDIDKTARDTIAASIEPEYAFSHAAGHGLGICVHENPPKVSNSAVSKTKILENTVFTIEPGVYKEGWGGIRLENTVWASYEEDKVILHSFSHFPFEMKLVDFSLLSDEEKYRCIKWQADASCVM